MVFRALIKSQAFKKLCSVAAQPRCWRMPRAAFSTQIHNMFTSKVQGEGENRRLVFFEVGKEDTQISPWHDIPLKQAPGIYTFVNEIPKGTTAKNEIATKEPLNPIKQDVKNGKLRFFTYGKIPFNYGAIPQTWEDPSHVHPSGYKGDNDPIDVVELSPGAIPEGHVRSIKLLGALALIDEGELDWKIIAIDAMSPLADLLNKIEDVPNVLPGIDITIREWFRNYKTTDGKPKNEFAFNEKFLSRTEAEAVVEETHERWKLLISGEVDAGKLWVKK